MSRRRVLYLYSLTGEENHLTLNVPVSGLTLSVHTARDTLGDVQFTLSMCDCECVLCGRSLNQTLFDCFHNVAILTDDIPEGVTDAGIGIGLIVHSVANVHRTIHIGRGLGFPKEGASDFVCHAHIIDTGSAGCDRYCATVSTGFGGRGG